MTEPAVVSCSISRRLFGRSWRPIQQLEQLHLLTMPCSQELPYTSREVDTEQLEADVKVRRAASHACLAWRKTKRRGPGEGPRRWLSCRKWLLQRKRFSSALTA